MGTTFFAMRSCEYLQTDKEGQNKRTKIVRVKNIKFKNEGVTVIQGIGDLQTWWQ